jgi:hypothetical protein
MQSTKLDDATERLADNTLESAVNVIAEVRSSINRALDRAEDRLFHEIAIREEQRIPIEAVRD